jgi:tetratricopeptide (TPR) repeat protein
LIRIHYVPPSPTTPLVEPPGLEHGAAAGATQAPWVGEQAAFPQGQRSRIDLEHVGGRGRARRNEKDALTLSKEWQELAGKAGKQESMFRLLHDATTALDADGKPNVHALRQARRRLRQWFFTQLAGEDRNGPLKAQVAKVDAALGRLVRRNTPPGEDPEGDGPRTSKPPERQDSLGHRLLGWVLPTSRDARALHREALKLWVAGETDQALDHMEAAADKAPQDWRIQRDLGRMLADEGYWAEAEWALLSASGLRPRDAELHMALGELYAQQELRPMAIEAFRAAIVRQPSLTDAHAQLGVALYDDGRPGEAAPHLQKAVSLDQQCVVARFYLAQVMLQQNDVLRARFQLGMVARMSPEMDLERFGSNEPAALAAQTIRKEATVFHWKLPGRPKRP